MGRSKSTRTSAGGGTSGRRSSSSGNDDQQEKDRQLKLDYTKDTAGSRTSSSSSSAEDKHHSNKRDSEESNNHANEETVDEEEQQQRAVIGNLLLNRAYHLPGNTYSQDLWQHFTNNHPILGICCHHRYHPLSWKLRIVSLFGSVLFGLALTNIVYLTFVFVDGSGSGSDGNADGDATSGGGKYAFDKEYITIQTNKTRTGFNDDLDDAVSQVSVTNGNIALWTIGAMIHGLFDNLIWTLGTCRCTRCCCSKKKRKNDESSADLTRINSSTTSSATGTILMMLAVILLLAVASFAALLRAALENEEETVNILDSHNQVHSQIEDVISKQQSFQQYQFIISYLVELVLTYVLYYPLEGIILFSGIISCGIFGRIAITGGRPYEVKQLKEKQQNDDDDIEEQGIEVEYKPQQKNKPALSSHHQRTNSSNRNNGSGRRNIPNVEKGDTGSANSDDSDRWYSTARMSAF